MIRSHGAQRQTATRFSLAFTLMAALLASLFSLGSAQAAVPIDSVQAYTQNFDSLGTSGSPAWTNDVTLKGWYAVQGATAITTYTAYDNINTNPPQGLYSFGPTNGTDRALGMIGGSAGQNRIGVLLQNTSGVPISQIKLGYTGEQWLAGAATNQKLNFQYKVSTPITPTIAITDTDSTWTGSNALDFSAVISSGTTLGAPVDGNAAANRAVIAPVTLNLPAVLQPGRYVLFRWSMNPENISNKDNGLAVDDLSIQAVINNPSPPQAKSCPANVTAFRGSTTSVDVSARDPNDTVTSAVIQSVTPIATGFSLTNQQPATAAGGTYTATLQIDGTQIGNNYSVVIKFSNNATPVETGQCTIAVQMQNAPTDLAVSKDGPVDYKPGQQLTYNITINPGPAPAANVVLTDTLPANLTYVSNTSGVVPTVTGQTVVWNFGTLSVPKTFNLVAASSVTASGTLTNTVKVSTSSVDTDQANNTASATTPQRPPAPDFSGSSKTVDNTTVQVGGVFTYTLTVANSGDLNGTFALTDTLPSGVTVVSAPGFTQNGQTLTASGSVAVGQESSYTVSVTASAAGTVNNTAQLSGDGQTRPLVAPVVTVLSSATPADFSGSTKTVDKTQAAAGDEVVYTITLSNSGQLQGTFLLTDTLDANLTLVSAPGMVVNGQTLRTSGTVNGGQTREYVIVARIKANTPKGTVIRNSADLLSNGQTYTLTASTVTVQQGGFAVYLPLIQKLP